MKELHVKYRPKTWDEVIGQPALVKSLKATLAAGRCRSFLFTGPSGTGKTTLARLIARELGIDPDGAGYIEFDGATNTGIDDTRAVMQLARLRPLGSKEGAQVITIDECHFLSKNAWASLLKIVEEPPTGVHWVFCTTETGKVPKAIQTRCQQFTLRECSDDDIDELLTSVLERAELDIDKDVADLIVKHAEGIPRRALVALGKVHGLSAAEAEEVLESIADDDPEVIDMCRQILARANFQTLAKMVNGLAGKVPAETIRIIVCAYFSKVCTGRDVDLAIDVLVAFGDPYPAGVGASIAPVLVSLAKLARS